MNPLLKLTIGGRLGQEKRRQPAPQQPMVEILPPEIDQVPMHHRGQVDLPFPSRQPIPKPGRRRQLGRTRGQDPQQGTRVFELPLGTVLSRLARAMAELEVSLGPYARDGAPIGKGRIG